ncbi:hypothetical protein HDE_10965 [Halotydeus destructor]|nr:hypothetical protein HDE_10965 [Halotydeus destructor]
MVERSKSSLNSGRIAYLLSLKNETSNLGNFRLNSSLLFVNCLIISLSLISYSWQLIVFGQDGQLNKYEKWLLIVTQIPTLYILIDSTLGSFAENVAYISSSFTLLTWSLYGDFILISYLMTVMEYWWHNELCFTIVVSLIKAIFTIVSMYITDVIRDKAIESFEYELREADTVTIVSSGKVM